MQIRLTVLVGPRSGQSSPTSAPGAGSTGTACDLLVTAPAGTPLAAVAGSLASAVAGADTGGGPTVLYAAAERLDPQRSVLGEPPLIDGAVLSLHAPLTPEAVTAADSARAQLHVIAGPDAGGVHLLHGGQIHIGRSADADVPLDDPDVSRLHCVVTLGDDGRVTVADPGSTNGTTLDGVPVGPHPTGLPLGAHLRLGESTLRLPSGPTAPPLPTTPDGEGRLRLPGPPSRVRVPPARTPLEADSDLPEYAADGAFQSPAPAPAIPPEEAGPSTGSTPAGQTLWPDPNAPAQAPPQLQPRRRGIGGWARRLAGGRETGQQGTPMPVPAGGTHGGTPTGAATRPLPEHVDWPDASALLLTALGPGPRLWERGTEHPRMLSVRLGTGAQPAPVTVDLRVTGSLGLAGPRPRLAGLARSVLAQFAALHAPQDLEIVLISTDRARSVAERRTEWSWLGWLPHLRPTHGQDCRLLLAYDRDQAAARTAELTRRLDEGPLGPGWASAERAAVAEAARRHVGPYTLVVLDGDPGTAALRAVTARLAVNGPAAGIHLLCLAEAPAASPASPASDSYELACAANPVFRECGAYALLSGDVATALRLLRPGGGHGQTATLDAVSAAWAERFARALAPLRADGPSGADARQTCTALPAKARLLDELGLARATPASLMARWAATEQGQATGGRAEIVLGAGRSGPLTAELVTDGPHVLIEGPAGSGRTELLRSIAASLAASSRPDRLGLLLVDGAGGDRGEGLAPCTELPHTTAHLSASDPVRMRAFAQALGAELKRRAEVLAGASFADWHTRRAVAERLIAQRQPTATESNGDIDSPPSGTLRLRPPTARNGAAGPTPLPRLVVLVDDYDALVAPALGSTGRPAAGSVVRALEAVAREGERLGVHLVASTARPEQTSGTELARGNPLRVTLGSAETERHDDPPTPGRGLLHHGDGRTLPFQGGRVTGRIPRTATLRPVVVPLEWERMGDPPTRRPVRELGNGPTDLALLASALDRAARLVSATAVVFPPVVPLSPPPVPSAE
ncbi:FtsK/SpoIIIE domain-containing protein [Streptomyces sp. NPDC006879]|uniref:FtsK/SpoIIIE domain-containing protein n=1 Tax=Streptomyces sp. NPDC006879 TaxID=3364767 RepID=UPI0036AD7D81